MKSKCLLVLILLCVFLSGCSVVGLEPQGLMQPPRATGDRQKVYDALEQVIGNRRFTLKYPRTGEYRSAIIMHPVSSSGYEDAIVLYQVKDADSPGVTITFLSKREGQWVDVGTYQSAASQVDRICFGDINGDGRDEIIAGWGNGITNQAELSIYAYDSADGTMKELTSSDHTMRQFYHELVLADFDNDGTQEIFTASLGTADSPANGKLLGMTADHKLEVLSSVNLDRDVNQYWHISAGQVDAQIKGVLLDGMTSSSQFITELVYWDPAQEVLIAPFDSKDTAPSSNPTMRKLDIFSGLRAGDSYLQFPIVELLPGYPADEGEPNAYLTHWNRYDPARGTTVLESVQYINLTHQYAMTIPDEWMSHVTAQVEEDRHSVTFYEWKKAGAVNQTGSRGDALLKLQAAPREQWGACERDASLSLLLEEGDLRVYASLPNPSNPLTRSIEQVRLQITPFVQNT